MAIQIIPQGSWGSELGTALGTGLGSGLESYAQVKLNQMMQQQNAAKTATGLQALGFSPQEAASLSNLEPAVLQGIVKQKLAQPSQEAFAQSLSQILGTAQPQGMQQVPGTLDEIQQAQQSPNLARLTQDQSLKLAQLQMQKQQMGTKEKSEAFKQTKEDRSEILKADRGAKENMMRLDRMEELSKSGKLNNPLYVDLLKKTGLDFPALLKPESQEFNKLSQDFLKDAKSVFGARISNFEAEQFLKSIPSLSQTKEGRERVIRNLKIMNEGAQLRAKTMREVIKENKGTPPLDLAEQIEERVEPKLAEFAVKFKSGDKIESLSVGQSLSELPNPSQYKGSKIQDEETGEVFVSDGTKWIKKG